MEEAAVQAGFAPETAEMLIILSLVINVVLMFAVAYLLVTRKDDTLTLKLETNVKKLTKDLKNLDERVKDLQPRRAVTEIPPVEAFGGRFAEPTIPEPAEEAKPEGIDYSVMDEFVKEFNLLAASMSVPKQLQACEKFVKDHGLKMIRYGGMMHFLPAMDVDESNYWAWKIPEQKNLYAVVPNPMKPCDRDVYERGGMNTIFESNYGDGAYARYIVVNPAMFTANDADVWQLQTAGELKLQRN